MFFYQYAKSFEYFSPCCVKSFNCSKIIMTQKLRTINIHTITFKWNRQGTDKSQLIFTSVEEQHVLTIINSLKDKSSYGHEGISNNLIKRIKDVLIKPLTLLINQMLSSGHFPSQLKISRVIPLFKSGSLNCSQTTVQYPFFHRYPKFLNELYLINYLKIYSSIPLKKPAFCLKTSHFINKYDSARSQLCQWPRLVHNCNQSFNPWPIKISICMVSV